MKRYIICFLLLCLSYAKGIAQIYTSWQDACGNTWKYEYYRTNPETNSMTIRIVSLDFNNPDYPWYDGIPDSIDGYAVEALGPIFKDKNIYGNIILPKTVIELDQTFQNCGIDSVINIEQIESLQNSVFQQCWNLKSVKLPKIHNLPSSVFAGCYNLTNVDIPNVTKIDNMAFYGCTNLQSIDINNVTDIESGTFEGCTSLQSVDLRNVINMGYAAFEGCTSLQSVDIPNVTRIDGRAFYGCTNLQNIELKNVTDIGASAFEGCTSLQKVDLNENIAYIEDRAFYSCPFLNQIETIDFPYCKKIGNEVFYGLEKLREVKLPKCESIGESAFYGCKLLKDISIPCITTLRTDALSSCQLNQLTLPVSIMTLGKQEIPHIVINATNVPNLQRCFNSNIVISVPETSLNAYKTADIWKENAGQILPIGTKLDYDVKTTAANAPGLLQQLDRDNLNSVVNLKVGGTINGYDIMLFRNKMDNLHHLDLSDADIVANPYEYYEGYCTKDSTLDNYSFSGLNKLISIKLPKSLKETNQAFNKCQNLKSVVLPDNIQNLGYATFSGCKELEDVEFKKCKAIGNNAFENCSVKQIALPTGLESIGESAFRDCSSLVSITLGEGLKEIKSNAFKNCSSLRSITIPNGVETIEPGTFNSCI